MHNLPSDLEFGGLQIRIKCTTGSLFNSLPSVTCRMPVARAVFWRSYTYTRNQAARF